MKFEAEIQKNTIDVAKILIFALFWSKNHNKKHNRKALFSQKSQYTPTAILRKEGLHEMGTWVGWGGVVSHYFMNSVLTNSLSFR